jgi:hypothetical protein
MKSVTTVTREHLPNTRPSICEEGVHLNRRRFLKTAVQAGALLVAPQVIPVTVLGKDGSVPPSERIVLGGRRGVQKRGRQAVKTIRDDMDAFRVVIGVGLAACLAQWQMGAIMDSKTLGGLKNLPTNVKHTPSYRIRRFLIADLVAKWYNNALLWLYCF